MRTIKSSFALTAVATVLTACGSSSSGDVSKLEVGAAVGVEQVSAAAAADTNTNTNTNTNNTDTGFVAVTEEDLIALAEISDSPRPETANLQVSNNFTFETARKENVYMMVPEAIGVSAEATFCTDYSLLADGSYDVDYGSCVYTSPMFGGVVDEEINLVNQYESVLGIVWFQDSTMAPQYCL